MTTDIQTMILNRLDEIQDLLEFGATAQLSPDQIKIVAGLSDITNQLGVVSSGELRTGLPVLPGDGFTGVRIAYPGMAYDGVDWHLVGVNDDVLQFGMSADDGAAKFGAGSVILDADGFHGFDSGGDETSTINPAGDAIFNNITARGKITAAVFEKGEIQATAGTVIVAQGAGKVITDFTSVASPTTFDIEIEDPATGHAALFSVDDILRIKNASDDNWVKVTVVTDNTTFYTYTCTLESGSGATFTKGQGVLDYGQSGDGLLIMSADETNAPYYSVKTHSGSPWTDEVERVRIGNLNGFLSFVTDVYGIGIGDLTGYLTYEPNTGLKILGELVTANLNTSGLGVAGEIIDISEEGNYQLESAWISGTLHLALNGIWLTSSESGLSTYDFSETQSSSIYMDYDPIGGVDAQVRVTYVRASDKKFINYEVATREGDSEYSVIAEFVPGSTHVIIDGIVLPKDDYREGKKTFDLDGTWAVFLDPEVDHLTASYQNVVDDGWTYHEVPTGTINGVNLVFTMSEPHNLGELIVILNGVEMVRNMDYQESDLGELTFRSAQVPQTGDVLWISYRKDVGDHSYSIVTMGGEYLVSMADEFVIGVEH